MKISVVDRSRWLLFGAVLWLALTAPPSARAAVLEVDRTDDDADAAQCSSEPNDCSLRGAVRLADVLAGPDTVVLSAGTYTLAIPAGAPWSEQDPAVGDLDVLDDLTIQGTADPNAVLVRPTAVPTVFDLATGRSLVLTNLSIRGGGVHAYGSASLTLQGVNVTAGNVAIDDASPGAVPSSLTVEFSRVEQDTSQVAALIGHGSLTVRDTVIRDNPRIGILFQSATGTALVERSTVETSVGGIVNTGTMTIRQSSVRGNGFEPHYAGSWAAAGISNQGTLVLDQSTVSGNVTTVLSGQASFTQAAGALLSSGGPVSITNSTISGNSVVGADGTSPTVADGVVFLDGSQAQLVHSTLTGNGGAIGVQVAGGSVSFAGTIVDGSCRNAALFTSQGFNLESPLSTCPFAQPGDVQHLPTARLNPLADNGGPTFTHLPRSGSAAVDGAGSSCPQLDQRGTARPQGAACDIGAVEVVPGTGCQGSVTPGGAVSGPVSSAVSGVLPALVTALGLAGTRRRSSRVGLDRRRR